MSIFSCPGEVNTQGTQPKNYFCKCWLWELEIIIHRYPVPFSFCNRLKFSVCLLPREQWKQHNTHLHPLQHCSTTYFTGDKASFWHAPVSKNPCREAKTFLFHPESPRKLPKRAPCFCSSHCDFHPTFLKHLPSTDSKLPAAGWNCVNSIYTTQPSTPQDI